MVRIRKEIILLFVFIIFTNFIFSIPIDGIFEKKLNFENLVKSGDLIEAGEYLEEHRESFRKEFQHNAYVFLAKHFQKNYQFVKALYFFSHAPEQNKKTRKSIKKIGLILGNLYFKRKRYKYALKYYKIAQDRKMIKKTGYIITGEQQLKEKAYEKAADIFKRSGLIEKTAFCYKLMALNASEKGDRELEKSAYKKALATYHMILKSFNHNWNDTLNRHRLYCISKLESLKKTAKEVKEAEKLKKILKGVGKYCEELEAESIYFFCREKITEDIYKQFLTKKRKHYYTYSYQLIEKNKTFKETRKLIRKGGDARRRALRNKKPRWGSPETIFKKIIFGPLGILDYNWQPYYNYKIIGEEKLNKHKVTIVECIPKYPLKRNSAMKENLLFGKVWIKSDDFKVLKIEWEPISVGYANDFIKFSPHNRKGIQSSLSTEYMFERNGIRYPTKGLYSEYVLNKNGKQQMMLSLSANYKNFKFFSVGTETEIIPVEAE